jgi:hypothetical protein
MNDEQFVALLIAHDISVQRSTHDMLERGDAEPHECPHMWERRWPAGRRIAVAEHRTKRDYAECLRYLVEEQCPHAERIYVVQDNLTTDGASYASSRRASASFAAQFCSVAQSVLLSQRTAP